MQRIWTWILNHRCWLFKCFADTWLTFWENLLARSRYRNSVFLLHCAPLYRLLLPSFYLSVEPGNIMQVHCSILLKKSRILILSYWKKIKLNIDYRARDECAFNPSIPEYLFFECPDVGDFWQYLWDEQIWLWSLWYLSQVCSFT